MMDTNRVFGGARQVGGKVEQVAGQVTGDTSTQIEGAVNEAMGTAQELYGQAKEAAGDAARATKRGLNVAKDHVGDFIEERPYTTAILALLAGMAITAVVQRSRDYY